MGAIFSTATSPSNVAVVDGAKNPELIPDSTAYRLWLVTVSVPTNATDKQRTFQRAHLNRVHLAAADNAQLVSLPTDFKNQYQRLISQYNESAKAALLGGKQADQQSFLQARDDLVSRTRAAITRGLAPESAALIDAHVQREKAHMQLHLSEGAQP